MKYTTNYGINLQVEFRSGEKNTAGGFTIFIQCAKTPNLFFRRRRNAAGAQGLPDHPPTTSTATSTTSPATNPETPDPTSPPQPPDLTDCTVVTNPNPSSEPVRLTIVLTKSKCCLHESA